jgi:integrase
MARAGKKRRTGPEWRDGNGRWHVSIPSEFTKSCCGRTHKLLSAGNERDAKAEAVAYLAGLRSGTIRLERRKNADLVGKTWADLEVAYLAARSDTRAKTASTIRQRLKAWSSALGPDTQLKDLSEETLNDARARLLEPEPETGKTLSPGTVRQTLAYAKAVLNWASKKDKWKGLIDRDLAKSIDRVEGKTAKLTSRDVFTRAEFEAIIAIAREQEKIEISLALSLLHATGCRVGEILGCTFSEFDLDKCSWTISHSTRESSPKNGETREVPLEKGLAERIGKYREARKVVKISRGCDPLFPNAQGEVRTSWGALTSALRRCAEKAGIKKEHITIHQTRHSFATQWVRDKKPLADLQKILGHADLTLIARTYAHLDVEDLRAEMFPASKAT